MAQVAPAFWVRYRGTVDSQRPNATPYVYAVTALTATNAVLLAQTITVLGPPQLNKQNFMEINWSPMVGLTQIVISRNSAQFYRTNGSSNGFRDEGQFIQVNGGVTNQ